MTLTGIKNRTGAQNIFTPSIPSGLTIVDLRTVRPRQDRGRILEP
jgi:hypothetical protein